MSWWAVITAPRQELSVRTRLMELDVTVFCPFHRVTRRQVMQRHRGWRQRVWGERVRERHRLVTCEEALFPRYLFAEGDSALIRQLPNVVGLVRGSGRDFLVVPDGVIDELRLRVGGCDEVRGRRLAQLSEALRWKIGDRLVIRPDRAFAGLEVTLRSVARLDKTGEIEGFIEVLGGQQPLKLPYSDLEPHVIGGGSPADGLARAA
jgi:transcription antitermination factor NusG